MKYLIPLAIIVLALLGANSIYVVTEGHAAIVTRFGHIDAAGVGPGLHFKAPFFERVSIYDTRAIVSQAEPETYRTSEGEAVRVGFRVRWRVDDPRTYYNATSAGGLEINRAMSPALRSALRAEVARHTLSELLATDGGPIDDSLRATVASELHQKLGISVLDVAVGRVMPPDDALAALYKRMGGEASARADAIRAKGDAEAAAIRAKGDRADQEILDAANKAAAVDRGQGDAAAAKVYAEASARDPDFFRYWSTLNTWRKAFSDGGAVVVIDRNSPFMRAIEEGATAGAGGAKH